MSSCTRQCGADETATDAELAEAAGGAYQPVLRSDVHPDVRGVSGPASVLQLPASFGIDGATRRASGPPAMQPLWTADLGRGNVRVS